ncbi:MAG: 23S rRNA (uracil(1939)-C(5))-methyltransferase RlmD [Erysipelotrichaceae bacterium]|nr:23S rRNA (uracil(1939)-C(5))-methyltransferase RlmD [Erysipelotrichaceae bacterium]
MTKLEIKKAGINGEGIGFYKRKPVFVMGCYPGEIVECELKDEGRHYQGELKKILKRSPERIRSSCPHYRKCGACVFSDLAYAEQLKIKKQLLEGALFKYCGYDKPLKDVVASKKQLHYRNKANLPVIEHDGILVNALYKQGSNHPCLIENCEVHEEGVEEVRKAILTVLNRHKLKAYVHKEKSGIRQLVVRGFEGKYQAVIISGNDVFTKEVIDDLKKIKGLVSLYQGINTHKNPVQLMPDKLKKLFGERKIDLHCEEYDLKLSAQAFFQLNRDQAERIYQDVASLIDEKGELLVEAYCGIGAISLHLHDKAEKIIGIEIVQEAITDAKENAKLNGINNIEFICDDASRAIRKIASKNRIDVLVVDPPRTGLDEEFITTVLKSKIKKIIYVSCNPASLAKDLELLQKKYVIKDIQGYDMFPQTPHCEVVVSMSRVGSKL